ncbi:MAG: hypothetical protein EP319_08785 [Deltaproteobacteria bacterium]|jgi:hypothetical protein|nr:MAG: hypothetical protein EP319_08785 [Deltaproteobacteria bacterium]
MNLKPRICGFLFLLSIFTFTGCVGEGGGNPSIPGLNGPKITINEDRIRIHMVFFGLPLDVGIRYPLPEMKDSFVELSPDFESSGTLMAIDLWMGDITDGNYEYLPSYGLPGNRPIPNVPGGRLPAYKFTIKNFQGMVIYFNDNQWGMFVPHPNEYPGVMPFPYFLNGKIIGTLAMVGPDQNRQNAGIFMLLNMDAQTKKIFKKRLKKYAY